MRTVLPCRWLVASLCGSAVATESQHSVVVDTPEVITLTHATPDILSHQFSHIMCMKVLGG